MKVGDRERSRDIQYISETGRDKARECERCSRKKGSTPSNTNQHIHVAQNRGQKATGASSAINPKLIRKRLLSQLIGRGGDMALGHAGSMECFVIAAVQTASRSLSHMLMGTVAVTMYCSHSWTKTGTEISFARNKPAGHF